MQDMGWSAKLVYPPCIFLSAICVLFNKARLILWGCRIETSRVAESIRTGNWALDHKKDHQKIFKTKKVRDDQSSISNLAEKARG